MHSHFSNKGCIVRMRIAMEDTRDLSSKKPPLETYSYAKPMPFSFFFAAA
jgi:hypothetical protein